MGLIGGVLGGIGSAVGGIVSGKAAKRAAARNEELLNNYEELLKQREADDKAWYEKEYNANFLERSDARAAIAQTRDIMSERYKQAEGSAAVTGATDASLARQKAAANEVLAEVTGSIAERADAYKDQVRANYESNMDSMLALKNDVMQQKMGVNNARAQATATTAQGIAQGAAQLGNGIDSFFGMGK